MFGWLISAFGGGKESQERREPKKGISSDIVKIHHQSPTNGKVTGKEIVEGEIVGEELTLLHKSKVFIDKKVKVGDVAINSEWQWITVMNPGGCHNGNGYNEFGESAGIKGGGKLVVEAVHDDRVLVSYYSPRGQGYGSEAGNGTLFFLPIETFLKMTTRYKQKEIVTARAKAEINSMLCNR